MFASAAVRPEVMGALEKLALTRPEWVEAVAGNPHLSAASWQEIYRTAPAKVRTKVRSMLVERPLGPEEIDLVASLQVTPRISEKVVGQGTRLSRGQFDSLAGSPSKVSAGMLLERMLDGPADAGGVPQVDRTTADVALRLARKAGLPRLLLLLSRHPDLYPHGLKVETIREAAGSDLRGRRATLAFQRLVSDDPALMGELVRGPRVAWSDLRLAGLPALRGQGDLYGLAGLGHADADAPLEVEADRRYVLLALLNNPVVPLELVSYLVERLEAAGGGPGASDVLWSARRRLSDPSKVQLSCASYADVDDPAQVARLVSRSTVHAGRPDGRPRPFDLVELAGNRLLGVEQVRQVASALCDLDTVELFGPAAVSELVGGLATAFPTCFQGEDGRTAWWLSLPEVRRPAQPVFRQDRPRQVSDQDADRPTGELADLIAGVQMWWGAGSEALSWTLERLYDLGRLDGDMLGTLEVLVRGYDRKAPVSELVEVCLGI